MTAVRALRRSLSEIVQKDALQLTLYGCDAFSDYLKDSHWKRILAYLTAWKINIQK
jgi:hypothetical protein